jgi:hypothetical protein
VYVWGRRHPYVNLSFLGIFNFTAPYLPWVLLAFSVTLRSNAVSDLLGIVAGAVPWKSQWKFWRPAKTASWSSCGLFRQDLPFCPDRPHMSTEAH